MELSDSKQVIVERHNKAVYLDGDRIIKVFKAEKPASDIFNEALNIARVIEAGVRVPKILEVSQVADGPAVAVVGDGVRAIGHALAGELELLAHSSPPPKRVPNAWPKSDRARPTRPLRRAGAARRGGRAGKRAAPARLHEQTRRVSHVRTAPDAGRRDDPKRVQRSPPCPPAAP